MAKNKKKHFNAPSVLPTTSQSTKDDIVAKQQGHVIETYNEFMASNDDKLRVENGKLNDLLKNYTDQDLYKMSDGYNELTIDGDVHKKMDYNDKAKMIEISDEDLKSKDSDIKKRVTFQKIHNNIVAGKGQIRHPNIFVRTLDKSMMGQAAEKLGIGDPLGDKDFNFTPKGLEMDGVLLNLTNDESEAMYDYVNQVTGVNAWEDNNFAQNALEVGLTFLWDMPLFMAAGAGTGAVIGRTALGSMAKSTNMFHRAISKTTQSFGTFQGAGAVETADQFLTDGFSSGMESIGHNAYLSLFGTATHGLGKKGVGLLKLLPKTADILEKNPTLAKELAGAIGGTGFMYGVGKVAGDSDRDALAGAVGSLVTHVVNPQAFSKLMREFKERDVKVRFSNGGKDPVKNGESYVIEKDSKYHIIDEEAFKKGEIIPLEGYNPIESTSEAAKDFRPVNQQKAESYISLAEALQSDRVKRKAGKKLKEWIKNKDVPKEFAKENKLLMSVMAEHLTMLQVGKEWSKINSGWKLKTDKQLHDAIIEVAEGFNMPYAQAKSEILKEAMNFSDKNVTEGSVSSMNKAIEAAYNNYRNELIKDLGKMQYERTGELIPELAMKDINKLLKEYPEGTPRRTILETMKEDVFNIAQEGKIKEFEKAVGKSEYKEELSKVLEGNKRELESNKRLSEIKNILKTEDVEILKTSLKKIKGEPVLEKAINLRLKELKATRKIEKTQEGRDKANKELFKGEEVKKRIAEIKPEKIDLKESQKEVNRRNKAKEPNQVSSFSESYLKDVSPALKSLFKLNDKLGVGLRIDKLRDTTKGQYNPNDNTITLNHKYINANPVTLVHEAIHPIYKHLPKESKPKMIQELDGMVKHFLEHAKGDAKELAKLANENEAIGHFLGRATYVSGTKSKDGKGFDGVEFASGMKIADPRSHELVTVAFSDVAFARYLDTIPATAQYLKAHHGKGTMFEQIKQHIKNLFSSTTKDPTLLTELSTMMDKYSAEVMKEKGIKPESVGLKENVKVEPKINEQKRPNNEPKQPKNESNSKPLEYNNEALESRFGKETAKKFEEVYKLEGNKESNMEKDIEKILDYQKVDAQREKIDAQEFVNGMKAEPTEVFKEIEKATGKGVYSLKTVHNNYLDLNLPPMFFAERHQRFGKDVHRFGEEMLRMQAYDYNSVTNWVKGWNGYKPFIELMGGKHRLNDPLPEGKQFMDAIKNYWDGRRKGTIERNLGWEEFGKWAGFNEKQMDVLHRMKLVNQGVVNRVKNMKIKDLLEHEEKLADYFSDKQLAEVMLPRLTKLKEAMSEKDFKKLVKKDNTFNRSLINDLMKKDAILKDVFARKATNELYKDWGKNFYYNAVRPTDPDARVFKMTRGTGVFDETATGRVERMEELSSYGMSNKEVEAITKVYMEKGWEMGAEGITKIGDVIKGNAPFSMLNHQQITDLATKGHLDMNNPAVVEALRSMEKAAVKGVGVHGIKKHFVEGMHFNASEFIRQMDGFTKQALYGAHKSYYLKKIDKNVARWIEDYNSGTNKTKGEKFALEYANRYVNQLKQKEHTAIDGLRGWAQTWQVGVFKPAFLVQQGMQLFQTTFNSAVAQGGGSGVKAFHGAVVESFKIMAELKALEHGYKGKINWGDGSKTSKDSAERMRVMKSMNKLGGQGIAELTSTSGEIANTFIDSPMRRHGEKVRQFLNKPGAAVESWTRMVTALTYEKMGLEKGMKGKELVDYMATGIDANMSEWGKGGRAPIFNSKQMGATDETFRRTMAKTFMTYKTFSFYNYGLWRSMIHNKQHAALASKVITATGTAGITRVAPLLASLTMLTDMFTDEDIQWQMWNVSKQLDDEVGGKIGTILHRGLPGLIGLDLRETFAQDSPLITDLWANSWANSWHGKMIDIALGAPFGFSKDLTKGGLDMTDYIYRRVVTDDFYTNEEKDVLKRSLKKLMPVSVKNIFNAMQLREEGVKYRGKVWVDETELNMSDLIAKLGSFAISKQTFVYDNMQGGISAQLRVAKEVMRRAKTHRKEFIQHLKTQGYSQANIRIMVEAEMQTVVENMNEARIKIKELTPLVRKQKLQQKRNLNN